MNAAPHSLHLRLGLAAAAFIALTAAPALSQLPQTVILTTTVDGQQETPPNNQPGTGTGTVVVDTVNNTAEINISFAGAPGANAAHIHGAADPGVPGGIMFPFANATSPLTGTWNYSELDEPDIIGGRIYVNIHSNAFPGGEIRGQIINATNYCWGDGSATACPCANQHTVPGRGCANTSGHGGLLLVTGDNLASGGNNKFFGMNLLPSQPALLFMGVNSINGGNGTAFGDGLRCAGGSVVRLGVVLPNAAGTAQWTPTINVPVGSTRRLQGWYRNPTSGSCTLFNLTNGLEITFI